MRHVTLVALVTCLAFAAAYGCSAGEGPNSFVGIGGEPDAAVPTATSSSTGTAGPATANPATTSSGSTASTSSGGPKDAGPDANKVDAGHEFDVPPTCTNGTSNAGNGPSMKPGENCNQCHGFAIAGTVYPTAHEPNGCKGANVGGTKIVVTDATGSSTSLTVNSAGNFYANGSVAVPYTVKVVSASGTERPMMGSLTSSMGSCNECHTQSGSGTPTAPGRILMPK